MNICLIFILDLYVDTTFLSLLLLLLFFFERASLIFIDQMVVNNNKILYGESMINAQSLIHPKPNSRQSPIF